MGIASRQVVEQIVQQDLDRQTAGRAERGGSRHREHAGSSFAHHHVFHYIAEGGRLRTPRSSTRDRLEQDDVGRSLATSTAVSTEMPTSAVCREGAPDAVAHEADPTAAPLQGQDDAVLLAGVTRQKRLISLDPRAQGFLSAATSVPVRTPATGISSAPQR
jgi:hypothetical protein